ncbi:metalloendoproteinase 2-MMP-like [Gastrolobium bilobum]|uniref:metalloendoproteinase 2-MMP-like n=1 Tax=Gastrolobium bilobum TaxID=150636 RepID=UPI002AB2558B|nr:metalloendoproteinase 2-MMP-like [Gastrolobium bilobum]
MSTHHHRYLLFAFAIVILSTTLPSASARLFPNVSSIPTWISNHAPPGAWEAYRNFTGCRPGQKYDGLSNLKNYFHQFGYIPNAPPSNFTDDFDDALESAVRTYQKNFNLNVTGELDDDTLKHIVLPRCGVADIINGTTTMNSGKSNATSTGNDTLKFHTVSHYTFFPDEPRWPEGTQELTYAFDPDENLDDVTKGVFANAFDRWSEVTTITFRETASYSDADIKIGFYSGDHGDGEPFDGVLGTLAHAFSPTNGRFHLDKAEDWVVTGDVTKATLSNAVDLESVAVHEIGHLLGLGHSSVEEAIMYPTITSRTRKVELADDDVEGIQKLYGSNPNFTGTSSTSSRERDSSHGVRHVGSTCGILFFPLLFLGFAHLIL